MDRRSATTHLLASLLALSCASGCSDNPFWSGGSPEPAEVKEAFDAPLPADGVIHIQKRAAFMMRTHTEMCVIDRLAPYAKEKQKRECIRRAGYQPIIVGIMQMGGDPGERHKLTAYKLVLAAWQNDLFGGGALWIGKISRKAGALNPNAVPTVDAISSYTGTRTQMLEYNSVGWDIFALSKAFVQHLARKQADNDRIVSGGPRAGEADRVAKFIAFLSGKRIDGPMSTDEFRRGGAWSEGFAGVTLQRAAGSWNVSEDDEGLLVLCKTVTERGFPPEIVRLKQPETQCSIVLPLYASASFVDLPIWPGGTPRVLRVTPLNIRRSSR